MSLFLQLHCALFVQVGLDDFEILHDDFLAELSDAHLTIQKHGPPSYEPYVHLSERLDSDVCWIMMAIINLSAAMQYGDDDSLLRKAMASGKERGSKSKEADSVRREEESRNMPTQPVSTVPNEPTAILPIGKQILPSSSSSTEEEDTGFVLSERAGMRLNEPDGTHSDRWQADSGSQIEDEIELPAVLRNALRLTFSMLTDGCRYLGNPHHGDPALSPYLTIILTFVGYISQNSAVLAIFERYMPWEAIVELFNAIPAAARSNLTNTSNRLFGTPLPEDWCIRGMEWTGRQLFGRGYWKSKFVTGAVYQSGMLNAHVMPEGEADVLAETYEGPSMPPHAGGPAEINAAVSDGDDLPTIRETVALLRWKRVALMCAWLIKAGSGLEINEETGKIDIGVRLRIKIEDWKVYNAPFTASQVDGNRQNDPSVEAPPAFSDVDGESDDLKSEAIIQVTDVKELGGNVFEALNSQTVPQIPPNG